MQFTKANKCLTKGGNPAALCPLRHLPCSPLSPSRHHHLVPASPPPAVTAASKGFGSPVKPTVKSPPSDPGPPPTPCSCQSGKSYKKCCQPAHTGASAAALPEAALRARFSAFILGQEKFIADTTHPDYLTFQYEKLSPEEAAKQYAADIHGACVNFDYEELKITKNEPGADDKEAFVAFTYRSTAKQTEGTEGQAEEREWKTTNERARFQKVDKLWLFSDSQRFEYNMNSLMKEAVKPEPIKAE